MRSRLRLRAGCSRGHQRTCAYGLLRKVAPAPPRPLTPPRGRERSPRISRGVRGRVSTGLNGAAERRETLAPPVPPIGFVEIVQPQGLTAVPLDRVDGLWRDCYRDLATGTPTVAQGLALAPAIEPHAGLERRPVQRDRRVEGIEVHEAE